MNNRIMLLTAFTFLLLITAWTITRAFTHPSDEMTAYAIFVIVLNGIIVYTFRHELRRKK